MKKIKTVMCACCAIASFSLISCMTVPKESEIPEDTTAADLTQKAQEAFDASNYRAAYAYYQIILNRFSTDESVCVAAEYEIAHLHIKKKKWQDAHTALEKIITKYEGPMGMQLPPDYYKLAKIDYARAAEKLGIKVTR
jgi:hypothetical protein